VDKPAMFRPCRSEVVQKEILGTERVRVEGTQLPLLPMWLSL
jgi:hypothetical protein